MPKSMVSYYSKLQDNLVQTSSFIASFAGSKDPATKKYRFDLQKAVNITINSISASSGESLIEKINRLQALLGGQSVDVMGKSVNVSRHPEARLYCCNLLAQKLVVRMKHVGTPLTFRKKYGGYAYYYYSSIDSDKDDYCNASHDLIS